MSLSHRGRRKEVAPPYDIEGTRWLMIDCRETSLVGRSSSEMWIRVDFEKQGRQGLYTFRAMKRLTAGTSGPHISPRVFDSDLWSNTDLDSAWRHRYLSSSNAIPKTPSPPVLFFLTLTFILTYAIMRTISSEFDELSDAVDTGNAKLVA